MNDLSLTEGASCPLISCDTGTDSPHMVAFAPQAAKASNCQYFAATTPRIRSAGAAVLILKNPALSRTILYVTIQSVSNYGEEAVTAHLAENLDVNKIRCHELEIFQTNLGCVTKSAAEACFAAPSCPAVLRSADFLTQDIVGPISTLRIDHQGGFVVTPGKTLAIAVAGLCPAYDGKDALPAHVDAGIDIRWWETPCNSHT